MQAKPGSVRGATAAAIVGVLLERPLAPSPRRSGELTRWQAFNTLWRQEWQAPGPEDRRLRWFAGTFTLAWHLFFGGLLLWLMYMRFVELEQAAARRRGEEEVVQVEFIGRGTPREVGGGQAPAPSAEAEAREDVPATQAADAPAEAAQEMPPTEARPPEVAAIPAPELPPIDAPVPEVPQRDVPEPQLPPEPPATQDVAVSAPVPDTSDFVLPPVTPRVPAPVTAPEIAAPAPSLQAVEVPEPVQPIRSVAPRVRVAAPTLEARVPEIVEREVAAPVRRPVVRDIERATAQPTIAAPEVSARIRDIPAPAAATQAPAAAARPASTAARPAAPASGPATRPGTPTSPAPRPASGGGAAASATSPAGGQGPRPDAAPGGFPTPAADDDWGTSARNVPGGQRGEPSGLYDAQGGPRLDEPPVNPGQPPGTLDDRIVDLDRSGTWLKRKPTDYEPTTFDRYWRPNENLLEEWVRKGIKKMAIPIPGTNKKIECVVSILQFGGGCGISDPNLNDQPAGARPPPDVPFKPHLQEDNGSVPPPGG